GAGKSTLIKILTGLYQADSGTIEFDGVRVAIASPADAERLGIHVIHQDRHLAGRLTVAEQLYLGRSEGRRGWVSRRQLDRRAAADLGRTVGLRIPPNLLVDELTVAEQQLVQIARAVLAEPRLLVLDEPTAPLASAEVAQLFGTIRKLQAAGVPVVYISHYLQELQQISGKVTVLRNGANAGEVDLAAGGDALGQVVELMVGREVQEFDLKRAAPRTPDPAGQALSVDGLTVPGALRGVSFTVRPGEIVGATGLVGSGVDELADAVTGNRRHGGRVSLGGRPVRSPRAFVRASGAYVPADRRKDGALVRNTIQENISLVALKKVTRGGLIRRGAEKALAQAQISRLDIRPARPQAVVGELSGGNQQKTVLARWLAADSTFLVLDQPTSGADVGSRAQIYARINDLVDGGAAALQVTVDLEELVGLVDRILVFFRGEIVAELRRGEATTDRILALASGAGHACYAEASGGAGADTELEFA
ncbi:sugar ABC transporter ATP-binding protein, partial [Arthrobacter deserti]|nr:sugar ABC transporter ATP-binding protein [Arthrobacter deserti]